MQYSLPNRHIAGLGGYDYHGDGGGGGMPLTAAARRAFWQTRRASTACACPPAWILRFRLRLDENGAHIRHAFAERERDGLAVVGEPVGFAALALVQQIGEQER